mgnify:CR=1 FL=1
MHFSAFVSPVEKRASAISSCKAISVTCFFFANQISALIFVELSGFYVGILIYAGKPKWQKMGIFGLLHLHMGESCKGGYPSQQDLYQKLKRRGEEVNVLLLYGYNSTPALIGW